MTVAVAAAVDVDAAANANIDCLVTRTAAVVVVDGIAAVREHLDRLQH